MSYPLPALLLFNLIQGTSSTTSSLFDVIGHSGNKLLFPAVRVLFIANDRGAKKGLLGSS